jgi:AcrR family transcriptional regulator
VDKKEQILNATIELITELGFSNFSVGKVANKLNVSKGVITYHFPTKEMLLQSAVIKYYEEADSYMEKHMGVDKSAVDTLNSYIKANLYFAKEKKKQTVAIVDIILNSRTQEGETLFKGDDNNSYGLLLEIFKYGQDVEKVYRNFSPEIMARSVRSVIDSICLGIAKDEISDVEKAVSEVKEIFKLATLLN